MQAFKVSVDNGVYFDHDGNGFAEKTGWISSDDALLVRDINGNGQIDNGSELFGDQTILSNGEKAANGFEALADLDSNHDGVFDGDDEAFGQIKVWQDLNQNGVVDDGELKTLNEAGITSINLNYQNQTITDNNGNEHNQTGSFTKTDATTGIITDVWFDVDYADTIDLTNVEISDEIAELPNVEGFGNVHDLHTAMALDTTGTLKTLVEQYIAATDFDTRDAILLNLIYTWVGVADIDPESRAATQIYGNVIGDARKLETLEEFLGEEYLGTWCWGERDPNPHGQAAPLLLEAFEKLKDYIDGSLLAQTHYQEYVDSIALNWNEETQEWTVDVTEALTKLQTAFAAQGTNASLFLNKVVSVLNVYGELGAQAISALKSAGDLNGTDFEIALATLGEQNVGTSGNDTISGTDNNDTLYGLAGNDMLSGKDGDDTLIGGAGNDHLIGGNGSDTYVFAAGFGHDTIDNTHTDNSSDTVLFGEGLSPENAVISREGYDLIIAFGTNDSLRIYSYFDERGQSSAVVGTIKFSDADETTWHFTDIAAITGAADGSDNFYIGTDSADTYDGLGGDDMIYGGAGDDELSGNTGDDILYGEAGDDVLDGGAGDDTLYGGTGSDSYKFERGSGKDTVIETDKNEGDVDQILLGERLTANDIFVSRDDKNLYISIYGTDEDPTIYDVLTIKDYYVGDAAKVTRLVFADGSAWNDLNEHVTVNTGSNAGQTIYGSGLADTITGTSGNDTIDGNAENDVLDGGLGNDILIGGSGDDVLDGGAGNDVLRGGSGSDVYKFGFGYNSDVIDEDSFDGDVIQLAEGISASDVSFGRTASALYIELSDHSRLTIKNFVANTTNNGIILKYADGSTVNLKQKLSELPITGTIFNDNLQGDGGNNTLIGRAGDDILSGYAGNDTLDGGDGDDTLYGGEGNDIYRFGFGYGNDVITDNLGTNAIELNADVSAADVSFRRDMYDLTLILSDGSTLFIKNGGHTSDTTYHVSEIRFLNGTDTAINMETLLPTLPIYGTDNAETIYGSSAGETIYAGAGHDTVNGDNGADTLYGGAGDDVLNGGDGNDILDGGAGNDTLNGGYGNDVYRLMLNGGNDRIIDGYGANVIEIDENVSASELQITRTLTSVKISLPDGSSFTVTKSASESEEVYHLETIRFLNGADADINFINRLAMEPLRGTLNNDTLSGAAGNDTLYGKAGHDTLYGYGGNDTLSGESGNDILFGGNGDDTLMGGIGDDTLHGEDGDDILDGGADDDNLYGGYGNDTYLFGFGDGCDYISDDTGANVIKLKADVTAADVTFERIGDDLVLSLSDGSALRIYRGGGEDYSSYHVPTIRFANGTDTDINIENILSSLVIQGTSVSETLIGENRDDILDGKSGNDTLQGRNGNDTYRFGFGDGNDIIEDTYGTNIIEMKADVSAADLSFKRELNDLVITLRDGSSIKMNVNSFSNNHFSKISFANGVDADIQISALLPTLNVQGSVYDDTLYGTQLSDTMFGGGGHDSLHGGDGNDILYGNAENDNLYGGNGNDILNGGEGNDLLYGGEGNDTYIFGRGYDHDTISDTQGENSLYITQADYDNLWLTRDGNNLKVSVLGTEDTVTINSWYSDENARLSQIQTDMRTIGTADIELLVQAMSSFSQPNMDTISQDISLSNGFKETVAKLWHTRT